MQNPTATAKLPPTIAIKPKWKKYSAAVSEQKKKGASEIAPLSKNQLPVLQ
ncbi:hypothetical protein ACIQLG_11015 [Terribacillus saccharophilus]|jgi:hypothetical protein|uniref:hypothetical protein n=1 Tax=Terribacillus saccharophilus TaxID=361277 RepID=UPI003806221B